MKSWRSMAALTLLAMPAAAQQPTQQQASALRAACRGDYQNVCAGVPTGGQAALSCLQQHASSVSGGCQQALGALNGGAPPSAASPAPGAPQVAGPPPSPRAEIQLARSACRYDYRRFCQGMRPGGGRILGCLKANGPALTPSCRSALMSMQGAR